MSEQGPPPPGPRPAEFVFPFRAALAAADALEAEVGDLEGLGADHEGCAGEARQGFDGASRASFDAWLAEALRSIDADRAALRADLAALHDAIWEAERSQRAAEEALADWHRRDRAYQAAMATQVAM